MTHFSFLFKFLKFLPPNSHLFFFFNDTATTEIYTLSLHDALPICVKVVPFGTQFLWVVLVLVLELVLELELSSQELEGTRTDRKSTRLNSSHSQISYAVFCLKKKKKISILASCVPPILLACSSNCR